MSWAPWNINMKSYQPFQIVDQPGRPSCFRPMYPPWRAIRSQNSLGISCLGSSGFFLSARATTKIHSQGTARCSTAGTGLLAMGLLNGVGLDPQITQKAAGTFEIGPVVTGLGQGMLRTRGDGRRYLNEPFLSDDPATERRGTGQGPNCRPRPPYRPRSWVEAWLGHPPVPHRWSE